MKKFLLFLFVCFSQHLFAQDTPDFSDMRSWSLYVNGDSTDRYIFSDTAYIRVSPDTKQAPIDTLLAGDNITVTAIMPNGLTIRGIRGPWLKIAYHKNGESRNGYIWQGLVSCAPLRRGDLKFVYGIERRFDSVAVSGNQRDTFPKYQVRLKVVQNGVLLAKTAFSIWNDESANFSYGKVMSGMGLTNVQHIVVLSFSGEACGIPTNDYYFAWTKDGQLVSLPNKTNVGDAGAFYHSEEFTFPNEKNGQPDMIVWNLEVSEATDKQGKNGEYIMKITEKKSTRYVWDGENKKVTQIK
ncbi:SH3 domain-containing protein [Chitinophaga qingshengii]|uniref:SH3 domain-containing protein n=1 Tax=Chitinophaga qingshengii TaxID=1569794 RepID=A0ABR7TQL6_9BACT|nr:SH3 domain-containing protein [Chitinophaga qingshengii]MBC9931796.1 SH3 domain-containing protein [Chitinophaga qingshengii]